MSAPGPHPASLLLRRSLATGLLCASALTMGLVALLTGGRARGLVRRGLLGPTARAWLAIVGVKLERVPPSPFPDEPCFFVANHTSALDNVVTAALGLPRTRFFTSRSTIPYLPVTLVNLAVGTFFLSEQHEPGKRVGEFTRATETLRRTGESAFLTPEGFRNRSGRIARFNKAAFHMATVLRRPIVPLFYEVPPGTDPGMGFFPFPGPVRVHVLPAVRTEAWRLEDLESNAARVRELFVEQQRRLYGECVPWIRDAAPEPAPALAPPSE